MKHSFSLALATFTGCFLLANSARADAVYWNGPSGGWDLTTNWTLDPASTTPNPATAPDIDDDLTFNRDATNGATVVSLNAAQAAHSLTFRQTGATTLQGGGTDRTMTLGAGGVTVNSGAGTVTIGSATVGQNVAVILNDSQSWTNNSANALVFNNGITGAATGNQILTLDGTGGISTTGGIANGAGGTVSLVKNGSGGLSLRAASSYTGTTTLNSGIISNGGVTSSISSAAGTGQLVINGGGITNNATSLNGNFAFANTSQVWGGDFSLSTQGSTTTSLTLGAAATNAITLTGNRIVSVAGNGNTSRININGAIGDGGNNYGVTWSGGGNVRVLLSNAASTYTGTTVIEAGWIQVAANVTNGGNSTFGNSTSTILLGGTSGAASAGILTGYTSLSFARNVTLQSGGTGILTLGGTVFSSNDSGGSMSFSGTLTLGTGSTGQSVTLHRGNFSGNIVDPAGLVSSPGLVTITAMRTANGNTENSTATTLSGNNSFSGGVNLTNDGNGNAGSTVTLNLNSATALGTGTLTIGSSLADRNVAINSTAGAPLTLTTNNAQIWNGDFAWTGGQALNMGTGAVSLGASTGTIRTLTTNGANALSIGGAISNGTTVNSLSKAGANTLILYGNSTYTGTTTISAGTLQIGNGGTTGSIAGSAVVNSGTLVFNRSNTGLNLGQVISGAGSVVQAGTGQTILSGNNTYTGATLVNAGTLIINGSLAAGSAVTVAAGASLGGSGVINGSVSVAGTLTPGNSPGILSTGSESWLDGGNFNFQIADATGLAGTGYDTIAIMGGLDLSNLSEDGFAINLWTLSSVSPDVNGNAANFNGFSSYSWVLASTTTGIVGFNANNFEIFTTANNGAAGFSNTFSGEFSIDVSGNNLVLNYTAVPEPSVCALLAMGLAFSLGLRRKSRLS